MAAEQDLCFPDGRDAALAQAKAAGKPIFTDETLNHLLRDTVKNKGIAAEAENDIHGFISRHFYLTSSQDQYFKTLPSAITGLISQMLKLVATDGGSAMFAFTSQKPLAKEFKMAAGGAPPVVDPAKKHTKGSFEVHSPFGGVKLTWDTEY